MILQNGIVDVIVIKRYNPADDQSHATDEVIQTIETLTIDVEDILDDWELLPHIQDYELSIDKPGNTIVVAEPVAEPEQEAARSLPTPEQTPEPIAQNQSDEPNQRVADAGTQDLTSDAN